MHSPRQQHPRQLLVEVVFAILPFHAVPAGAVTSPIQVPLHFLADTHIFRLHLIRDEQAITNEVRSGVG
jgi:hypothetical protein